MLYEVITRKQIEDLKISVKNGIISTTITLGVSSPDKATSIHSIINCADQCLYRGKYQGKNQVVAEKCWLIFQKQMIFFGSECLQAMIFDAKEHGGDRKHLL